jgi:hypothetical protein
MGWYQFETFIWWLLHKTPRFWHSKNGKCFFWCDEKESLSHPKIHTCEQYEQIITNYAAILAITLVAWFENHENSKMIAHFGKVFFVIFEIFQIFIFPCNYIK